MKRCDITDIAVLGGVMPLSLRNLGFRLIQIVNDDSSDGPVYCWRSDWHTICWFEIICYSEDMRLQLNDVSRAIPHIYTRPAWLSTESITAHVDWLKQMSGEPIFFKGGRKGVGNRCWWIGNHATKAG